MSLELAIQKEFNGIMCDFYCEKNNYSNLWMTRNQIGQALEYKNANDAIRLIHNKYPHRFETNSVSFKLNGTDGKLYDTIAYNRRGIMEICRWSRQPKADEFMDWVWDLVEAYQDGRVKTSPDSSCYVTQEQFSHFTETFLGIQQKQFKMYQDFFANFNTSMSNLTKFILASNNEPKPPVHKEVLPKAISALDPAKEYRKRVSSLCKQICGQSDFDSIKEVLAYVYKDITARYGIVWEQEKKEYKDVHGYYPTSVLAMISESDDAKHYKSILMSLLEDKVSSLQVTKVPVSETDIATNIHEAFDLVTTIAVKTNDRSPNAAVTYNRLYNIMEQSNAINWKYYRTAYKRNNGIHSRSIQPSKKAMIGNSIKLQKLFINEVNKKMEELNNAQQYTN